MFKIGKYLLEKEISNFEVKGKTLDIGCGTKPYGDYLSLDINEKCKPDIVASICDMPIDTESIETVICAQVIEYLDNPEKAFGEINRVLVKGGRAIITCPMFEETSNSSLLRYTDNWLIKTAEKTGFAVESIKGTGGFFSLLGQLESRFLKQKFPKLSESRILKLYYLTLIYLDKLIKSDGFVIDWVITIIKI